MNATLHQQYGGTPQGAASRPAGQNRGQEEAQIKAAERRARHSRALLQQRKQGRQAVRDTGTTQTLAACQHSCHMALWAYHLWVCLCLPLLHPACTAILQSGLHSQLTCQLPAAFCCCCLLLLGVGATAAHQRCHAGQALVSVDPASTDLQGNPARASSRYCTAASCTHICLAAHLPSGTPLSLQFPYLRVRVDAWRGRVCCVTLC